MSMRGIRSLLCARSQPTAPTLHHCLATAADYWDGYEYMNNGVTLAGESSVEVHQWHLAAATTTEVSPSSTNGDQLREHECHVSSGLPSGFFLQFAMSWWRQN